MKVSEMLRGKASLLDEGVGGRIERRERRAQPSSANWGDASWRWKASAMAVRPRWTPKTGHKIDTSKPAIGGRRSGR